MPTPIKKDPTEADLETFLSVRFLKNLYAESLGLDVICILSAKQDLVSLNVRSWTNPLAEKASRYS